MNNNAQDACCLRGEAAETDPDKDVLGRKQPATILARQLRHYRNTESALFVGIMGSWGSGKTTFWNFVEHALKNSAQSDEHSVPSLQILRFEAWKLSGNDEFAKALLTRLGTAAETQLRNESVSAQVSRTTSKGTRNLRRAMNQYAARLAKGAHWLSEIADGVGLSLPAKITKTIGSALGLIEQDSISLRDEICTTLADLERPIVVVVDEIDRLADDEITDLFRILKANVDFPNVIYVLLFDRDHVARALDKVTSGRGDEYVEKIVQVPLPLTEPVSNDFQKILRKELALAIKDVPHGELLIEPKRLEELVVILAEFMPDLRAVNRYLNAFRFYLRAAVMHGCLQLNPVDVAALEAIRIQSPASYERMMNSCKLLDGSVEAPSKDEKKSAKREKAEALFEELLTLTKFPQRESLRKLIYHIFPAAIGGPEDVDIWETAPRMDIWFNKESGRGEDCRIYNTARFASYFVYQVFPHFLGQHEIDAFLKASVNADEFFTILRDSIFGGAGVTDSDSLVRYHAVINAIRAMRSDFAPNVEAVVDGIFAIGDRLGDMPIPVGDGGFDSSVLCSEVAIELFSAQHKQSSLDLWLGAINRSRSLFAAWHPAMSPHTRRAGILIPPERLVSDFHPAIRLKFEELKDLIPAHPRQMAHALAAWRICGGGEDALRWALNQIASSEGCSRLIRSCFTSEGGTYHHGAAKDLVSVLPFNDLKLAGDLHFRVRNGSGRDILDMLDYMESEWEKSASMG